VPQADAIKRAKTLRIQGQSTLLISGAGYPLSLDRIESNTDGANMNSRNARLFAFAFASIIFASINSASAQIVALGHSAVRGNVAESEMWPALLEGLLRARGSQVHVANAGVWGETTGETLARVSSAVPEGTRIVILADSAYNDVRHNMSPTQAAANIAAIKSQLRARGIRIVDATPTVRSISKQPGGAGPDGLHLSVEGNKKVAAILVGMVR
jgi:acyl-CoA thioesterase-1